MPNEMISSPPTPEMIKEVSNQAVAPSIPQKSNTDTTFTDMLNEVLTSGGSYARKFIALKKLGMTDEEIKKVLKQYDMVIASQRDDQVFLDTKNSPRPSSGSKKTAPKAKKRPSKY